METCQDFTFASHFRCDNQSRIVIEGIRRDYEPKIGLQLEGERSPFTADAAGESSSAFVVCFVLFFFQVFLFLSPSPSLKFPSTIRRDRIAGRGRRFHGSQVDDEISDVEIRPVGVRHLLLDLVVDRFRFGFVQFATGRRLSFGATGSTVVLLCSSWQKNKRKTKIGPGEPGVVRWRIPALAKIGILWKTIGAQRASQKVAGTKQKPPIRAQRPISLALWTIVQRSVSQPGYGVPLGGTGRVSWGYGT